MTRPTRKTIKLPRDEAMEKLRVELQAKVVEFAKRDAEILEEHTNRLFKGAVDAIGAFREVVKTLGWPLAGPQGDALDFMQGGVFEIPAYGAANPNYRNLRLESFRLMGDGIGDVTTYCQGADGAAMVGRLMTGKPEIQAGKYRWAFIAVRVDDEPEKK